MAGAYVQDADGRWLIVRRLPRGLLGAMWELPMFPVEPGEPAAERRQLAEALERDLDLRCELAAEPLVLTHTYSHLRVRLALYTGIPHGGAALLTQDVWDCLHWLSPEQEPAYGLTGLTVKARQALARVAPARPL
jgi:adenine-specific DNA glycosylase